MEEGKNAGRAAKDESPQTSQLKEASESGRKTDYVLIGIGCLLLLVPIICSTVLKLDDPSLRLSLRVITALGGALIGGSIPGLLEVKLPFARGAGAMALILLFYAVNPPGWIPSPEPEHVPPSNPQYAVLKPFTFNEAEVVTKQGYVYPDSARQIFEDRPEVISKGDITMVRVWARGLIHGLQFQYGTEWGKVFGFTDRITPHDYPVPPGKRIVAVDGDFSGYYLSRIRFGLDDGEGSDYFGEKQGTPFTAESSKGFPLRTIGGNYDLIEHESEYRHRAITRIIFYFAP